MSLPAAIVLAPPIDSYPPLRVVSEAASAFRIEPCACGGSVVQLRGEQVTAALTHHQRTLLHASWRRRNGL